MARCPDPQCGGYLIYEPELAGIAARVRCIACGWMMSDPNFRKEQPSYFPSDVVDKRLGWQMQHPGYDLYFPSSSRSTSASVLSGWSRRAKSELRRRCSSLGPRNLPKSF